MKAKYLVLWIEIDSFGKNSWSTTILNEDGKEMIIITVEPKRFWGINVGIRVGHYAAPEAFNSILFRTNLYGRSLDVEIFNKLFKPGSKAYKKLPSAIQGLINNCREKPVMQLWKEVTNNDVPINLKQQQLPHTCTYKNKDNVVEQMVVEVVNESGYHIRVTKTSLDGSKYMGSKFMVDDTLVDVQYISYEDNMSELCRVIKQYYDYSKGSNK